MESEEETITAGELLKEQLSLENDAKEILPGCFNQCTYSLGRLNQPIYTCLTCTKKGEHAGFCYSCSISCHYDHEIAELFYKRDFICECGSNKYNSECNLWEEKRMGRSKYYNNIVSSKPYSTNDYNHNFDEKYCLYVIFLFILAVTRFINQIKKSQI